MLDSALSTPMEPTFHRRILVADTDAASRELYRLCLTGCDVVEALDGREALTKALVRVPALVITELSLPIMDGLALCEVLRQDRTTRPTPILIVTAETSEKTIARAHEVADAVLLKPTSVELFRAECQRLFAKSRALTEMCSDIVTDTEQTLGVSATMLRIAADLEREPRRVPRTSAAKTHSRFVTTTPPAAPGAATCPNCDRPLAYDVSYVGGVNERYAEQWDYLVCRTCGGGFQFRQRTRKLRTLSGDEQQWLRALKKSRS